MEERLLEDADKAESEHAVFQKKLDRLKASFIGSPLTIIRIVLSLLPIGALMLPLANVSFWGPFFEKKVSVNAITIYNAGQRSILTRCSSILARASSATLSCSTSYRL